MEPTVAQVSAGEHPLDDEELAGMHAYWRACNYLAAGMVYLQDNPLLRELQIECRNHAHQYGIDAPEMQNRARPY